MAISSTYPGFFSDKDLEYLHLCIDDKKFSNWWKK